MRFYRLGWLIACMVAASQFVVSVSVLAATSCTPGSYQVSQNTNARTGASTEARILTSVAAGTEVQVVGERLGTVVGNNGVWCELSLNGASMFVHSGALTLLSAGQAAPSAPGAPAEAPPVAVTSGQSYRVIGGNSVNGRAAANTGARIVIAIPAGSEVVVTGQESGARVNGSDVWFIVVVEGQTVYVHSSLLTPVAPAPDAPATAEQLAQTPQTSPKGTGSYAVNADIAPGRWESTGNGRSCYWERLDAMGNIIQNHFGEAGGTVTVSASDARVNFERCGTFYYVAGATPLATGNTTAPKSNGFYTVGTEIATGHWTSSAGSTRCYWERLDANQNIIDNHFGESGGYIHISPSDYEVHFSGCGNFIYVDGQPPVLQPDGYSPRGNGFYRVGQEIGSGNWRTTGSGSSCYWARLNAFQEIIENSFGGTWEKIYVAPTDFELYVSGCGNIVYEG